MLVLFKAWVTICQQAHITFSEVEHADSPTLVVTAIQLSTLLHTVDRQQLLLLANRP